MRSLFLVLGLALLEVVTAAHAEDSPQTGASPKPKPVIAIIVGPTNHPPGTHEVAASGRLIAHCLQNMSNLPGVSAEVFYEWPKDDVLDKAAALVFTGDNFPGVTLDDSKSVLAKIDALARRGCGIVCIHYATGLRKQDVPPDGTHPLLAWTGGYFATKCDHHQSIARIYPAATITPGGGDHPVLRGWKEFTLRDEPYINNYFGKDDNKPAPNVTAIATSMLPPESPKKETVAWAVNRDDGGRGMGIVMPHFFANWKNEDLRKCILNGIVWAAKLEVPAEGVNTSLPDLVTFKPEALEPRPKATQPATPKK